MEIFLLLGVSLCGITSFFLIDFVEVACAYGLDVGGCECDFYFVAGVAA